MSTPQLPSASLPTGDFTPVMNPSVRENATDALARQDLTGHFVDTEANFAIADAGAVPGYEIIAKLGQGGMGVVYRAQHLHLNRMVALKMMLGGADRLMAIRFLAEAEAVAAVRHPSVVQVYDFGQTNGQPFMALEFVDGGSLADRLKDAAGPAREAADLIAKIAPEFRPPTKPGSFIAISSRVMYCWPPTQPVGRDCSRR